MSVLLGQSEMQLSGFANAPVAVNPACAGRSGDVEVVGAYRAQWVGFDGAPSTTILSVDAEVKFLKNFHGVGAMVINDVIGAYTEMEIAANYSYPIELKYGTLGLGMRLGALNVEFDASELHTTVETANDDYHQETDEALEGESDSGTAFDVGLGAYYQDKTCYLSLSILHLDAPKIELKSGAIIKRKPCLTIAGGKKFGRRGQTNFEPRLFMKTDFSSFQAEAVGFVNFSEKVGVGLGYRLQDAVLIQLGLSFDNGLKIAYDYDLNASKMFKYNTGSHEIAASYTFNLSTEKRTKRYKSVRIL